MSQLRDLSIPFGPEYVHTNPSGGGSYVKHHVIVQRLLSVVGPYSFHVREILYGAVPAISANPQGNSKRAKEGAPALENVVVGVIAALTCTIDNEQVTIEEVGDCEDPHNWPHDGARMKDAMSDAIKRCAARLGLGLHLWAQDEYFLPSQLAKNEQVIIEAQNGAGQVIQRWDRDTGEIVDEPIIEGQAALIDYTADDPERPFE